MKFISSNEFLKRRHLDYNPTKIKKGGELFVGNLGTYDDVKKFFDELQEFGVSVSCEDNPRQPNFAPTIRLTFHKDSKMLKALNCVHLQRPDAMDNVTDDQCDFWWD